MEYRTLGSTGLRCSVVGVGTWQFGGEWAEEFDQAKVDGVFDAAREAGINLVDTAECYGDHLSERLVGRAIARDREDWVVATKFGHRFKAPFDRDVICDPAGVRRQLEDSLRALGTEVIDLYQFHSGNDELFQTEGLWEMLREEQQKGKIRHLGLSISPPDNIYQTERARKVGAEVIQVIYNRLDRKAEKAVLPACQDGDLGVLARVPLASGFLSGKYRPGHRFPKGDARDEWKSEEDRTRQLTEVVRIAAEEVPEGVAMASWALAWCLRSPAVTAVIPGCRSAEQVRSNASAVELDIGQAAHPQASAAPA